MAYFEVKYFVSPQKVDSLKNWLEERYQNSDAYGTGLVHSVYFDTPSENAFWECMDGAFVKRKIRLRGYSRNQLTSLQIKKKTGQQVWKKAFPIALSDHRDLASEMRALQDTHSELLALGQLQPTVEVTYTRCRYRTANIRFTLDHCIELRAHSARPPYLRGEIQLPFSVLELKVQDPAETIPDIHSWHLEYLSFSKFLFAEALLRGRTDVMAKYI